MFRLHLFIKKQAHTARKGSVGLNNNVAQFETNFDSPHLSPGVVLIRRYSSLSRGNSLMKGMMELPIRIRP